MEVLACLRRPVCEPPVIPACVPSRRSAAREAAPLPATTNSIGNSRCVDERVDVVPKVTARTLQSEVSEARAVKLLVEAEAAGQHLHGYPDHAR